LYELATVGMVHVLQTMSEPLQAPLVVLQVRVTLVPNEPAWHDHVYVAVPAV